jgi:DhnA family fructose-bisphosphate aldolase class Ia
MPYHYSKYCTCRQCLRDESDLFHECVKWGLYVLLMLYVLFVLLPVDMS